MAFWDLPKTPRKGLKNQPPDLDEALKKFHQKLKKIFNIDKGSDPGGMGSFKNQVGLLAMMSVIVFGVLWGIAGIFIVNPAEQAAILRFGKYIETVGPGPHWLPPFIEQKIIRNVDSVSDYSYSAQMLTKDENLVSVALVVQYRIGDLAAYLFNVADPKESLHQATSSALRQVVGTTTLDQMITEGREAWGSNVRESLNKILSRYKTGIVIVNVSPQPARAPDNVQDAFDDAIKAQEDEKRFKEQAYAYKAQVVPIAEGKAKRILEEAKAYAEKVVLKAHGETAEFLAMLIAYEKAPQVTVERMYLDTIQTVLSTSTKVIVEGKGQNLLYLPLDKLLSSKNTLSANHSEIPRGGLMKGMDSADSEMAALLANRRLKRPTYEQGEE